MIREILEGDKVKGEIEHILYKPQISYIRQQGMWYGTFINVSNISGFWLSYLWVFINIRRHLVNIDWMQCNVQWFNQAI